MIRSLIFLFVVDNYDHKVPLHSRTPTFDCICKLVLYTEDGTNGTSSSERNRGAQVRSKLYIVRDVVHKSRRQLNVIDYARLVCSNIPSGGKSL